MSDVPRREVSGEEGEAPAESDDGLAAEESDEGFVDRTEHLADRTLERFREEAQLPDVREEAGRAADFLASIHSRFLGWTLFFFVVTGAVGTGVALFGGLPDWYMHGAMYVVILSFFVIYVKAHLKRAPFARAFYALATLGLMGFFAWVLLDLAPSRLLVADGDVVKRAPVPLLQLAAGMLALSGVGLALHWLVLARYRDRSG